VLSQVGEVGLAVPRDHDGSFHPTLVPKGARRLGGRDDMIISLYAGGMTIRDIEHHLATTIGAEMSRETISKITDSVLEEVAQWQKRPPEELYPIVCLDALVIKIRDVHQVKNRSAHIAVGVELDGTRHVLGIWVAATTRDYQPHRRTKRPQTEKVPNLMQVRNYSDVLRHHIGGRCRIRTCVGVSRRIYSPLPLAARATCRGAAPLLTRFGATSRVQRGWP
jgi:hypothetical protein